MHTNSSLRNLLVVGDWFVDEHWVTGIHRSPTASRAGLRHARALHGIASNVESLCGAGRVASILHQATLNAEHVFRIIGVGAWHSDDQVTLRAMLDPSEGQGQTPHRLTRRSPLEIERAELFNIGALRHPEECGTTRVIRIYEQTGREFTLQHRLDWEPRNNPLRSKWHSNSNILQQLKELLERYRPDAVFIKDAGHGTVFPELIGWLRSVVSGETPWFVSSKVIWDNELFDALPVDAVRLVVVPPIAAMTAVRDGDGRINSWITPRGYATKAALVEMDRLAERFRSAMVVVLPHGMSLLARDFSCAASGSIEPPSSSARHHGILQKGVGPNQLTLTCPMASVFFPAMAAEMIVSSSQTRRMAVERALRFTAAWMFEERARIDSPETWRPTPDQSLRLEDTPTTGSRAQRSWEPQWAEFDWNLALENWKRAFSDICMIDRTPKDVPSTSPRVNRIEVWRAMTEVDDYVCCLRSKRVVLRDVLARMEDAKRTGRRANFMFVASPGTGKTFLMARLARTLDLTFLQFNITQLIERRDIIDCFDTIVTTQAQTPDHMVLAFFDEINAKLEAVSVYDTFLAPMELGQYLRGGKVFHIAPCIMVFASTKQPQADEGESGDTTQKWSDFKSRLTTSEPYEFGVNLDDPSQVEEAQVEKLYLGVSLLRTVYPDVLKVTEKVLHAFRHLPVHTGARDIEKLVRSCHHIQHGVVSSGNLPRDWRRTFGVTTDEVQWKGIREGTEVEIQTTADADRLITV